MTCNTSTVSLAVQKELFTNNKGSMQTIVQRETFELYPSESIFFGRIDTFSSYKDNVGNIDLYWTCLNCKSSMKEKTIHNLTVRANAENGTYFKNTSTTTHNYTIYAYGYWTNGGWGSNWFGMDGEDVPCTNCVSKDSLLGSLLVRKSSQMGYIEDLNTISLKPGEKLYFKMNDQKGGYTNNEGELKVQLVCEDCSLKSHPIDI